VLATNAYTSKLGYLSSAIAPIFNYVCITPPIDAADWNSVGWTTRIPFNDSRREVYYAGATRDRRVHFGGGPVDYCFNDGLRIPRDAGRRYAELQREFATLFPALAHIAFETTWSGLVDVSLDQNPAIGQIGRHQNIFYAIGYSGEGVNLTSVFGRVIADLAAGRREQWTWLPFLDRLPPYIPNEPFRWLAIEADLEYSRVTGG
jgi:glycine/D-amino acid oxidase-like deaminating enzyme